MMFYKNLDLQFNKLYKLSLKRKKKSVFILSSTSDDSKKKYLTPIRESVNSVYMGAVIYDDLSAKKITDLIKNKVDFLFVDTEKKTKKKNGVINIERTVRENIDNKKLFYFKANDLTVNAASNLLETLFYDDIRNTSNKKILIIGSGNIGFKLGLQLIERGARVTLYRKKKYVLKNLIKTINFIKPKATLNNASLIHKIPLNLKSFDIIINTSNSNRPILTNKNLRFNSNTIFIEIGTYLFNQKLLLKLIDKNVKIFRLDVTNSFNELIEQKINNRKVFIKKKFLRLKKGNKNYISVGLLGKTNDIVVDNPLNPKKIYGVIDKNMRLKNW